MSAMGLLVDATIKVSVLLTIALVVAAAMGKRSAAVRHWVLAVAIGCSATIPLLGLVVPAWNLPLVTSSVRPSAISATDGVSVPLESPKPVVVSDGRGDERSSAARLVVVNRVLGSIWIAGVVVNVGILLVGIGRLAAVAARSQTGDAWRLEQVDRGHLALVRPQSSCLAAAQQLSDAARDVGMAAPEGDAACGRATLE